MEGFRFLYETDKEKIAHNKRYIAQLLRKIKVRQFKEFHNHHKFRLFIMYRYLKGGYVNES